jgi:mono/diheme cytochrome c family protein
MAYYEDVKSWIFGFIVGLLVLPVFAYIYLASGMAPVATAAHPLPLERYVTHKALDAVIDKNAPKTAAIQPTEANLLAGVPLYEHHCAVCHGLPDRAKTSIAKGEFPAPPQLFKGKGVTDDPAGETFWKVKYGIRLTGMPGFEASLNDEQMWQISQLLATEKLPDSVTQALRKAAESSRP